MKTLLFGLIISCISITITAGTLVLLDPSRGPQEFDRSTYFFLEHCSTKNGEVIWYEDGDRSWLECSTKS